MYITAGRNELCAYCCSYVCWCTDNSLLTADCQLNFCVKCEAFHSGIAEDVRLTGYSAVWSGK